MKVMVNRQQLLKIVLMAVLGFFSPAVLASTAPATGRLLDLTATWYGIVCLVIFVVAYALVISEEFLHLRKSKPVMVAAGLIWILVGVAYVNAGDTETAAMALRANLLEYAELLLFLLAAMTYINTLQERNVFEALRSWLVSSGFSLKTIYWLTGLLAFFISPAADNLTTALIMVSVVLAVAPTNASFIVPSCISIVVAANAGGAFSPFGDITTLMVWQKGMLQFNEFFYLFFPSLLNWLIPAIIMYFALPNGRPDPLNQEVKIKAGGLFIIVLFLLTIVLAVSMHSYLHLPPVLGMMTGLGILKLYGYHLKRQDRRANSFIRGPEEGRFNSSPDPNSQPFDIYKSMERIEWDTLMFFYGIVLCVGGLGTIGYLTMLSNSMYGQLGPTTANILIGLISAVIDNIPVMYAVLSMNPVMSDGQWLLVTLTAGVGGSLLSIGSAAGVAVMGQAKNYYTFFAHLKWTWAIALGYAGSIGAHFLINRALL